MEKLIYLLWAPEERGVGDVREVLLGDVAPDLLALGPERLSMNIDDEHSTVASPVPPVVGETPYAAEVSLWLRTIDDRAPYESVLAATGYRVAGYLVTESLCTDYGDNRWGRPRDWDDGERSPYVLTVAGLERPDSIPYERWVAHWHGVMSPVSGELQPRARYVRNAVVRPVTANAPALEGIVEEAWPSAEHISDPYKFFCAEDDEELAAHGMEMAAAVTGFLELDRIRNVTMSEYLLKT